MAYESVGEKSATVVLASGDFAIVIKCPHESKQLSMEQIDM